MATSDLPNDPYEYDRWFRDHKPDQLAEGERFEAWMDEYHLSENQLHKIIGRPRSYIQQRRELLHAYPDLIAAWRAEQLQWSDAREILDAANGDHEVQRAALEMVIKRRKSKRRIDAAAIRNFTRGAAAIRANSPQG